MLRAAGIQPSLQISEPGDPLEEEADRVATEITSSPTRTERQNEFASPGRLHNKLAVASGGPPESRAGYVADPALRIQRLTGGSPNKEPGAAPASVDRALASVGRSLDPALRDELEQRFGHDFSQVRVHTDAAAAQSAREVNARAYTVGHDIVFGAGRFTPATREGQRLLAHELTHVAQQESTKRDALQPAPPDAGTPSTAAPVLPTRIPDNEEEAIEDTEKAYPTDAAVRQAIAELPSVVQKELGSDVEYQRRFLYRTSLYLGPHPKPVEHFKGIQPFSFRGSDPNRADIFLHADAIAHLQDVKKAIGAKDMPSSSVGFSLRGLIRQAAVPPPGLMVHALGYAIDFRAQLNPHIKDPRLVAVQALYTKDPQEAFHMQTGKWPERRATIARMGRGEIAEGSTEMNAFIKKFQAEALKDLLGNIAITSALSPDELKDLHALRIEYKVLMQRERAVEKNLVAERKKLKRSGTLSLSLSMELLPLVAEQNDIEMKRKGLITRTQKILGELTKRTTSGIQSMVAARFVTGSDKDYKETLAKLAAEAKNASSAERKASREHERARALYNRHQAEIARLKERIKLETNVTLRDRLEKKLEDRDKEMVELIRPAAKESFDKWFSALGVARDASEELALAKGAAGKRRWLHDLEALQSALSVGGFDPKFVFGIGGAEGAEEDVAVRDPSLVQLFSKGFFNPDPLPATTGAALTAAKQGAKPSSKAQEPPHGFSVHFMEEMAKHGFDQGAEWTPGGIDSMHFEFVEGVDALHYPSAAKKQKQTPGKSP
jgi:hypothetical protein